MDFKRVGFLEYMSKGCQAAKCSIGSSDVPAVSPDDFGLSWDDIFMNPGERKFGEEIREAIAARYKTTPDKITTGGGSTMLTFLTIAAIFDRPGAAMIEKPVYHPLQDALIVFSSDVRSIPRWIDDAWTLDLELLELNWDPSVRVIVLTNLNNPTGARTSDKEIARVAEIAARSGGYVLVDEVFREFDFDAEPGCAANVAPNVITTASFSKSLGFGNQRYGWWIGPPELKQRVEQINCYIAVGDHMPVVGIMLKAFENIEMLKQRSRGYVEAGHAILEAWISTRNDLECWLPAAGPMAFPRMKDGSETDDIADALMSQVETLIAPGRYFGDPSAFRLGFAMDPEKLRDGLDALGRVLDERRVSG